MDIVTKLYDSVNRGDGSLTCYVWVESTDQRCQPIHDNINDFENGVITTIHIETWDPCEAGLLSIQQWEMMCKTRCMTAIDLGRKIAGCRAGHCTRLTIDRSVDIFMPYRSSSCGARTEETRLSIGMILSHGDLRTRCTLSQNISLRSSRQLTFSFGVRTSEGVYSKYLSSSHDQ